MKNNQVKISVTLSPEAEELLAEILALLPADRLRVLALAEALRAKA
jgi:hypothetical protein